MKWSELVVGVLAVVAISLAGVTFTGTVSIDRELRDRVHLENRVAEAVAADLGRLNSTLGELRDSSRLLEGAMSEHVGAHVSPLDLEMLEALRARVVELEIGLEQVEQAAEAMRVAGVRLDAERDRLGDLESRLRAVEGLRLPRETLTAPLRR